MIATKKTGAVLGLLALGAVLYVSGATDGARDAILAKVAARREAAKTQTTAPLPPSVSTATAQMHDFVETVLVTGSLVPRDEILVAPEIEGLRVLELKVDEGDEVKQGQVLAVLTANSIDAQLAENDAQLARSNAAISQAQSQIAEAEARAKEAAAALERAKPLKKQGWIADSAVDQRESLANSTKAQVTAARDGLKLAEAEKAQVEARRRELDWRRGNVEVKSPADGLVSRRNARIGGLALSVGEPMFRIIARGEVELDAEVTESQVTKLKEGQPAVVTAAGGIEVSGKVRLVSPQIDSATRLGRVRIFIGANRELRIGGFANASIETARERGIALPVSAISYSAKGAFAQVVVADKVDTRAVTTGLTSGGLVQIKSGVAEGETVVARAGTFLRDGDAVRPVAADPERVSAIK